MGAWEDCGLGVCACGQERRVYRPLDSAKTPVCSECATRHRLRNIVDLPPSVVDPEEQAELREQYQWRQRRLDAGRCIDCGLRPRLAQYKRCSRCHDRMRRYRPPKMGGAA